MKGVKSRWVEANVTPRGPWERAQGNAFPVYSRKWTGEKRPHAIDRIAYEAGVIHDPVLDAWAWFSTREGSVFASGLEENRAEAERRASRAIVRRALMARHRE